MNLPRQLVVLALPTILALAGCGGTATGAPASKPLTDAQREADISNINSHFAGLQSEVLTSQANDMVAYLKTLPDIEAEGIATDGCAWGRFTDGRMLCVITNRAPGGATPDLRAPNTARPLIGQELPSQTSAYLANVFEYSGTYHMGSFHPAGYAIDGMLAPAGYQIEGSGVQLPSVESLKGVTNNGIFFMDTHGGYSKDRQGNYHYAIFTSSSTSAILDASYKSDLDSAKLIYMTADVGPGGTETHYAATPAFVTSYMKFGPNSLVFMNFCTSEDPVFKEACLNAGAGYYLGWTAPVDDESSCDCAKFVFDRLLGLYQLPPIPASPMPPETISQLAADVTTAINPRTTIPYYVGEVDPRSGLIDCQLVLTAGGGSFNQLVPILTKITTDPKGDTATLTGNFGSVQGTVDTGGTAGNPGTDLVVTSWSPTSITVQLTNSATNAIVRVSGRPSASLAINPFAGNYTGNYTGTASDGSQGGGTFTLTVQPSGNITGTGNTNVGPLPLTGAMNTASGQVQFGTGTDQDFQATFTGTFVSTSGKISASGNWNATVVSTTVTESGTWATQ
jgi:hypothetical protein